MINVYLDLGIHTEAYTAEASFISSTAESSLAEKHAEILRTPAVPVSNLGLHALHQEIIKIFLIARDPSEREKVSRLFEEGYAGRAVLTWGPNPNALPAQYGWITALNISKRSSVLALQEYFGIPYSEFFGVGGSISDWEFMDVCGRVAAMGNSPEELKLRVSERGSAGLLLPDVDEDGLLRVLS